MYICNAMIGMAVIRVSLSLSTLSMTAFTLHVPMEPNSRIAQLGSNESPVLFKCREQALN